MLNRKLLIVLKWICLGLFIWCVPFWTLIIVVSIIGEFYLGLLWLAFIAAAYISACFIQWWTSLHILLNSSINFLKLKKVKIWFLIFNVLTLNIFGIIIYFKLIKRGTPFYSVEELAKTYDDDYSYYQLQFNIEYKWMLIINSILIVPIPLLLWTYFYTKYSLKTEGNDELYYLKKFTSWFYIKPKEWIAY